MDKMTVIEEITKLVKTYKEELTPSMIRKCNMVDWYEEAVKRAIKELQGETGSSRDPLHPN